MEFGSIEREIHVDADPEVVFEVISSPQHMREWWNGADTDISPVVGSSGEIAWGRGTEESHIEALTVVEAEPNRRFAFRWVYDGPVDADGTNSLLVTFDLVPSGAGTTVRLTETGFREMGWEAAVLEAAYADHANGWDIFVPAIGTYVRRLVAAS